MSAKPILNRPAMVRQMPGQTKPIIFNGEMVRAILAGRKTQTRRIIPNRYLLCLDPETDKDSLREACRYGRSPGWLWVRERHTLITEYLGRAIEPYVVFPDGAQKRQGGSYHPGLAKYAPGAFDGIKWRPSIHLPRWASRLTLRLHSVGIERVTDISVADCQAEGVIPGRNETTRGAFTRLWMEINGADSWSGDTWVFVLNFSKAE